MVVKELQFASNYDFLATTAARSVLVEIAQILGSFKGKFAVLGGAVSWLSLTEVDMLHCGTVKEDLRLEPSSLGDGEYVRLVEALRKLGYHQRDDRRPFQLVRTVPARDSAPDIEIVIDFLMPRDAQIAQNSPPFLNQIAVQRADGAEIALMFNKVVAIEDEMPGCGVNLVRIAVASILAFRPMKGYANYNRKTVRTPMTSTVPSENTRMESTRLLKQSGRSLLFSRIVRATP